MKSVNSFSGIVVAVRAANSTTASCAAAQDALTQANRVLAQQGEQPVHRTAPQEGEGDDGHGRRHPCDPERVDQEARDHRQAQVGAEHSGQVHGHDEIIQFLEKIPPRR